MGARWRTRCSCGQLYDGQRLVWESGKQRAFTLNYPEQVCSSCYRRSLIEQLKQEGVDPIGGVPTPGHTVSDMTVEPEEPGWHCASCRYWDGRIMHTETGFCRHNPPPWGKTHTADYCGSWEPQRQPRRPEVSSVCFCDHCGQIAGDMYPLHSGVWERQGDGGNPGYKMFESLGESVCRNCLVALLEDPRRFDQRGVRGSPYLERATLSAWLFGLQPVYPVQELRVMIPGSPGD